MTRVRRHSERGGIISSAIFLAFLIVFCFVVYLARHPLLRVAGAFWIVDESPQPSDAIVILGDDNYNGDRATRDRQRALSASLCRNFRARSARSDRSRRTRRVGHAIRAPRRKHERGMLGARAVYCVARLEENFARDFQLPHPPLA